VQRLVERGVQQLAPRRDAQDVRLAAASY
jgi:hypothetical protein